jgi:carboxylesterase
MREAETGGGLFLKGGAASCLIVHGLSGASQAKPLAEALNNDGFTVSAPEIHYANETSSGASPSKWGDWLDAAREAYSKLDRTHDSVAVIGFGVGGALSMILAAEYPVSATALIAPLLSTRGALRLYGSLYSRNGVTGGAIPRLLDLLSVVRFARRSMFAVVAPVLILTPDHGEFAGPTDAKHAASLVSSRDVRIHRMTHARHDFPAGADLSEAWGAIKSHLRHASAAITLENE